jgi:hypothetical protein
MQNPASIEEKRRESQGTKLQGMTDEQGGENEQDPGWGNTKTKAKKIVAERREFRLRHMRS